MNAAISGKRLLRKRRLFLFWARSVCRWPGRVWPRTGVVTRRDLIVLPDRVVSDWWRRESHSLAMDDLDEVLDELPGRLVLGVGADV